jgi:cysteine desulfurase
LNIYLDNNATTGLDPRVLEAMLPHLSLSPENPSSPHSFGRNARAFLQIARQQVADFFNVSPKQVIFTSGATEGLNSCLKKEGHLITSEIEHAAILTPLSDYPEITYLKASSFGAPLPSDLEAAITPRTKQIILSAANNETGVKSDLGALSLLAKDHHIPLIIDGVGLLGKDSFSIPQGVAAIAFSSHKIHGPKGVGCLILNSSYPFTPFIKGGGQEYGLRSGTENLPGIIGFAKALELLSPSDYVRMRKLRDDFESRLPHASVNGLGPRVSSVSNLTFEGCDGETLLIDLDRHKIAVSHGSACASLALEPSHVLLKMGYPRKRVLSSLRFSLSRFTTKEELDSAIERLLKWSPRVVAKLP